MRPLGALLVAAVLLGCASPSSRSPTADPEIRLLVFGAASLATALEEATAAYRAVEPSVAIELATGSSSTLATQILQGAPADLFLSADTANPARLRAAGLVAGDPVPFAGNTLVVIVPADDATVTTPADLARPGVRIIAAGDEVPISRYAADLVAKLGREPGYPADFAAAYAANVVSREDDVRALVTKVALGEGDAGIAYRTDALGDPAVRAIEVPPGTAVHAEYAGAVLAGSAHPTAAAAFLSWLAGPEGRAILARSGFDGPTP